MPNVNPSVQDFKDNFYRDFPFGTNPDDDVLDLDIVRAMKDTNMTINPDLFLLQSSYTVAYLELTAHFLVINLRASSQGMNGQYSFLQSGRSAGPTSESSSIPPEILNDPNWSMYCKTNYGAKYASIVIPRTRGAMFSAKGHTKAD